MKLKRILYSNGFISLLASIASICFGLLLGFILLCCFNPPFAITGFKSLISAGFRSTDKFAKVLYQAAPLVMTGLSVAFAFKTGLELVEPRSGRTGYPMADNTLHDRLGPGWTDGPGYA